jgi:nickel-dependent lactate racemase
MISVDIPFWKNNITLNIPSKNVQEIISGKGTSLVLDEGKTMTDALENPINSRKLSEIASGKKSACIIASDITRPCPSYKFLPLLVDELRKGRIKDKDILVLLGLGIHRCHSDDEKRKLVGDYIYDNIETIDSDISESKMIGHTSKGTPVEIFKRVLEYDLLIVTGNIEYHYFAGFSGGAKAVMPGICTRRSIQSNHSMMLDKRSTAGRFLNNPVRDDIEEAGKLAGIDFMFNVIINDEKKIIAAVAGKNNDAYLEGIKEYESIYSREVESAADIVITSQGGYPKDMNLYQSHKALENVKGIAADKGTIILVASCCEGFGDDTFEKWMTGRNDYSYLSKKIAKKFVLGGHKAVRISEILTRNEVLLYSDFSRQETERMGFKKIEDIQKYLDKKISQNSEIKITVVPNGRFVRIKFDDTLKN